MKYTNGRVKNVSLLDIVPFLAAGMRHDDFFIPSWPQVPTWSLYKDHRSKSVLWSDGNVTCTFQNYSSDYGILWKDGFVNQSAALHHPCFGFAEKIFGLDLKTIMEVMKYSELGNSNKYLPIVS